MSQIENVIDLRQFQSRFRQALVFSLFEGLRETGTLTFIDEFNPDEMMQKFKESNLLNSKWRVQALEDGSWAFEITKTKDGGCCGCCGGGE